MEAALDRFGRVVIPKRIRDALGLKAGDALEVVAEDRGIRLSPRQSRPTLIRKRGVLVFTGEALGDMQKTLDEVREDRIRDLARWERR